MDLLGLQFDDSDFEQKQKTTAGTKTSYNAKICSPLWFDEEELEAPDLNTYIHQQKFSADYYFYKEKYDIAATKYKMLLDRIPESSLQLIQDVQESLCRSCMHLGRHEESLEIARNMVQMMRTEDEARQRQSLILLSQVSREAEDWAGCIGALEQLASQQSHYAPFWLELGRAYRYQYQHRVGLGDRGDDSDTSTHKLPILTCLARARILVESVQNCMVPATQERNEATICKINEEIKLLGVSEKLICQALDVMRTDLDYNSAPREEEQEENKNASSTGGSTEFSSGAFRKRWFSWIDKYEKT